VVGDASLDGASLAPGMRGPLGVFALVLGNEDGDELRIKHPPAQESRLS
jgi:hypothetical protein